MFIALLCSGGAGSGTAAQQFMVPVIDPAAALLAETRAEALRGVYVFYTQDYKDKQNERVAIHGSV